MDAYRNYNLELAHTKLGELRREAAEHRMSAASRRARGSWPERARGRIRRDRPGPSAPLVMPATPVVRAGPATDDEVRRSA